MVNRIIGKFIGKQPGALVIATGAVHGNERAGVQALEDAFRMLEQVSPAIFRGSFIGLIGNRQAYLSQARFIERDLNRIWTARHFRDIRKAGADHVQGEDREMLELYEVIHEAIHTLRPERLFLLDLHTTSATGGIFCIPADENQSLQWAKALLAPVILNLFDQVEGTLLRFTTAGHFSEEIPAEKVCGVAFESGQHDDPLSAGRSLTAVINTLHFAGCLGAHTLRSPHEAVLQRSFAELPRVTRLVHAHHITSGDRFKMQPGYVNFQQVKSGELLATDAHGDILAPFDSRILMPLYQPQGSDGFFLVKEEAG